MKKKVSITIDRDLLNQIEELAKKKGINRSKYIENVMHLHLREIPVVILASESKINGQDKSLTEYKKKKLIDIQIDYIKNNGFKDIYVSCNSIKVKNYLEKNYREITVIFEEEKIGNGGTIKNFCEKFGRKFVFIYCDVLMDLNLRELVKFHIRNKSSLTLGLKSVNSPSKYGVAILEGSKIEKFEEKPEQAHSHLVYIGVGMIEPEEGMKIKEGKFELQLNNIENKHGYIYEREWKSFEEEKDFKK